MIVGGGRRGVVTAACYIARTRGVRSAMPMFKALRLCPDAVVIKPDMAKYVAAARAVRALMEAPDAAGAAALDRRGGARPVRAPRRCTARRPPPCSPASRRAVEREVGVTVSIGLAPNRLLAKLAAERDKPRGFAVIGAAEAASWLAPQPVTLLPGIGPALARRLEAAGFTRLGQLAALDAAGGGAALRRGRAGPRRARPRRGHAAG